MGVDDIGRLLEIQSKDNTLGFDRSTDSLEALRDYMVAVLGDNQGLAYYGVVTDVPGGNQFTIAGLSGYGAGKFTDPNAPWWALVFRDAGGGGGPPQGEMQAITAYVTATGIFTTAAFTFAVAVDDEILLLNPIIAAIGRRIDTGVQTVGTTISAQAYIKGILDILAGAAGITAWAARAKAGNTISMAEAIRDIDELKPEWNARSSGTWMTSSVNEETILTTAYTTPGRFFFNLTLRNMIAGDDFTIRVYKRVDGANYDLKSEQQFLGNPNLDIYEIRDIYTDGTEFIRVTIQRASGIDRAFPYSYNIERQPVV